MKVTARIPVLDAFSQFLLGFPMKLGALLSTYGGLVPLGYTHSNVLP